MQENPGTFFTVVQIREAASEISDIEKNALTAIRQSITKILFNISFLTVEARSSEGKLITQMWNT